MSQIFPQKLGDQRELRGEWRLVWNLSGGQKHNSVLLLMLLHICRMHRKENCPIDLKQSQKNMKWVHSSRHIVLISKTEEDRQPCVVKQSYWSCDQVHYTGFCFPQLIYWVSAFSFPWISCAWVHNLNPVAGKANSASGNEIEAFTECKQ